MDMMVGYGKFLFACIVYKARSAWGKYKSQWRMHRDRVKLDLTHQDVISHFEFFLVKNGTYLYHSNKGYDFLVVLESEICA